MVRTTSSLVVLALLAAGCSDPPAPVAEVAAQYTISGNCGASGPPGGIGATEPLYENYPTGLPDLPQAGIWPQEKGGPIIDGLDGPDADGIPYDVSCRLAGDGPMTVELSLKGQNTALAGENIETSLSITGTIEANGTGTVDVAQFTRDTGRISGTDCTITAVPKGDGSPNMKAGELFAVYECKGVNQGTDQPDCNAKGTLVLSHCSTN